MRIQVANTSYVHTEDLRRAVRIACCECGVRFAKDGVLLLYARVHGRPYVGGQATCYPRQRVAWGRAVMWLYFPRNPAALDAEELVHVIRHEAMHLVGATHGTMTRSQRFCVGALPRWAECLRFRIIELKPPNERLCK